MITRTGLQVLTDALKLLGVVAGHEVPTSAEQQDSFARLNELIDSWGTHAQTMFVRRRDVVPLVAGMQTYSIGVGGAFNVPRPMSLTAAARLVAATPPIEVALTVLTDQQYVGIPVKTLSGTPTAVLYSPDVPLGEVWVWPVPTAAQSLVLYFDEPVASFPDLVTPVALAPGYARALRTNLALELAPEFGRPVDPVIDRAAHESLADLKRQNLPFVEVALDPGLLGETVVGGYDILSDS